MGRDSCAARAIGPERGRGGGALALGGGTQRRGKVQREVKGQSGRATSREIEGRCDAKALRDRLGTTWGRDS